MYVCFLCTPPLLLPPHTSKTTPSYEPLHIIDNERRCTTSLISNAHHLLKQPLHPPPLPVLPPLPTYTVPRFLPFLMSALIQKGPLTKIQQHSRRTYLSERPIRFFFCFLLGKDSVSMLSGEYTSLEVWGVGR